MSERRLASLFAVALLLLFLLLGRLYLLAQNTNYAQTAQNQTITTLTVERRRGDFYDASGRNLTRYGVRYYALSIPGESSYAELFRYATYDQQSLLYNKRKALAPFLVEVTQDLTSLGIYTYTSAYRYNPLPIAAHLIGYLDGDGQGVSGLEAAFNELLQENRQPVEVACATTAQGQLLAGQEPQLTQQTTGGKSVVLTLEEPVQRACEAIAQSSMKQGCILVLDTATAKVRASVSMPEFNPLDIQSSLDAQDTSLLNRVFCAYNVGSVFKPVLAAAALEEGLQNMTYECTGALDLNGHLYHCAQSKVHGSVDLQTALEQSCNGYFIQLGLNLGAEKVEEMAQAFGFGQSVYLAGGLQSAAGVLPTAETLENLGQLAGLSFGQGQLLATPLQLAGAFNVLAADGVYRTPSFLEGVWDEETQSISQSLYQPQVRQVVNAQTANTLRTMLMGVVQQGTGKLAAPSHGSAAGKTGTAQTAVYDENGAEEMNHWFVGFYPAENPLYTIVVMQDGAAEMPVSSSAIFAQVCDALYWMADSDTQAAIQAQTQQEAAAEIS
ncbi:peptidoglycan D,D-transpeptidase FtsI family protein [uncultured Allofournierella sp.]|uniref:peptidoglycan D,D-transpeptidase FtsI family protein n=1 Tax=uncultured Allofournierella sp. TaxID=1940258 RepID=UPI003751CACB